MKSDLQTVAVYNQPMQANMACNALKSAGLWAVVADAELVSMDLLLSSAVGGVKVQVKSEDAQKAADILMDIYGDAGGVVSNEVDVDELTRQAMAEMPEEEDAVDAEPVQITSETEAASPATSPATTLPKSEREEYARRFFLATFFSIVFLPFIFYAIYLGLTAVFGSGSVSKKGLILIAISLILLPVILLLYAAYLHFDVFFVPPSFM
ncbi:hypothetical protein BH11PLA2_BH11PLA2_39200 [soil metagenome]